MKRSKGFLFFLIICLKVFSIQAQNSNVSNQKYHTHRTSLKNSFLKFTSEKSGRVAFLGGFFTFDSGWRDSVSNYLMEKFPETEFDFVNAGIPYTGTVQGAFRFEDDVLKNGPVDLLFIESEVKSKSNKKYSPDIIRETEGIIRHALISNPTCDIICIYSGNEEHFEIGEIPYEIKITDTVLKHYNISSINLVQEFDEKILTGELENVNRNDIIGDYDLWVKLYSQSLKTFLEDEWNTNTIIEKISAREFPTPIDESSFFNGRQIAPDPRKSIKGWQLTRNKTEDIKEIQGKYAYEQILEGTYPGKIIKFHFKGNTVGVAVLAGLDAGSIEYSVDNHPWKIQDFFIDKSDLDEELRYYVLESGLKNRKHTLQLRVADEKNPESSGYRCDISYFFFNGE